MGCVLSVDEVTMFEVKSAPRATGPPPSQDSMCESSLDADAWPFAASSETSFMESTQLLPDALMQKFERHGPQLRLQTPTAKQFSDSFHRISARHPKHKKRHCTEQKHLK
eukprot:1318046-Amphidinium_carterae.1